MKTTKFLAIILTFVLFSSAFVACGGTTGGGTVGDKVTMEGVYSLYSAKLGTEDVTDDFSMYLLTFEGDSLTVVINYLNLPERRESSYTATKTTVTETYKGQKYTYTIDGDTLKTRYKDLDTYIDVVLKKETDSSLTDKTVDFESVLFGESINDVKKFNYCPAILTEVNDEGETVMHIWYCTNKDSGIIMDHIGYRTGVLQENGKWLFSDEQIVLAPTPGTWDSRHTCDPTVIKGEFKLNGETYNYLMSYLGCTTEDYQKNETGLAVAKNVGGPWVKVDNLNPIVPWYDDGVESEEQAKYESYLGTNKIYWGTGMPSLISVDGKGDVLLFYQSTKRGTGVRRLDLSDLNNPQEIFVSSVNFNGAVNSQGVKCSPGIADFAYDKTAKRLYVTATTNEKRPPDVTKTLVSSHSALYYVDVEDMNAVCELMKNGGGYKWNTVGFVGPDETGWNRNHNPALVKTDGGYIPDSTKIGVVVSTGNNDWANENIFTYRLFGHWFNIK